MIPLHLLSELSSVPLYKQMLKTCLKFDKYLDDTREMKLVLRGLLIDENGDPDAIEQRLDYYHRWHPGYQKARTAQLFQLQEYLAEVRPAHLALVTYTGRHDSPRPRNRKYGIGYVQWNHQLREARRKSKDMLKHYLGPVSYLDIWEPHPESGFSHIHSLYIAQIEKEIEKKIKTHYASLGIGSYRRGVNIETSEPKNYSDIRSVVTYLLSYMDGTFIETINEWTVQDLIFNAALWTTRPVIRAFQPSHDLSRVMAYHSPYNARYVHVETLLSVKGCEEMKTLNQGENYDEHKKVWDMLS